VNARASNVRIPAYAFGLLALIILLAGALRLPDLTSAPPGGHGDVSWVGINALDWVDRGVWPFYIRELYSPEFPVVLLNGLLIPLIGTSFLGPRLITAATGIIFVALLFPAAWWLCAEHSRAFRVRAGLLAALSGAVSLHAMYLSRLGMESPPFLAALTLLVWWVARAWVRGGWKDWAVAGAALAFTQYIYLPARVLPLMLALWFAHGWLTDRERARLRGWIIMASVALVLTLPALILFVTVPGSFSGRADAGTAITGGWVWAYDLSAQGGLVGLLLQKLWLTLRAFGVASVGAYTIMGQPMLGPLFFGGLIAAFAVFVRRPRERANAWPFLAIPVLLITDLISGAVPEIHALHQMGVLPFAFILSGIGLARLWDLIIQFAVPRVRVPVALAGLALAIIPSIAGTWQYLRVEIPAMYADPRTGPLAEQIDVDLSARILAAPEKTYLLPYAEYSRSNFAWLLASAFRERRSVMGADGTMRLPELPSQVTVIRAQDPLRPRHDGRESVDDPHLWVLLTNNQTLFLPPFSAQQSDTLTNTLAGTQADVLNDRSATPIAALYTVASDFLATVQPAIVPLDAVFNNELALKGYSIREPDLTPGSRLDVTLYWNARTPPGEDYNITVQLWDDARNALISTTDFPYGGAYRTRIWRADETIATTHWVRLPETLPTGRYTLAVGVLHLLGGKLLPVVGRDTGYGFALTPDLRRAPPAITLTTTTLVMPVKFGGVFRVRGADLTLDGAPLLIGSDSTAGGGQILSLALDWETLRRPPRDYSVFLHIAPAPNVPPTAQNDRRMGTDFPTGAWRPSEIYHDILTVQLPKTPGCYRLFVGVYYWQSGERLTLGGDVDQWEIGILDIR